VVWVAPGGPGLLRQFAAVDAEVRSDPLPEEDGWALVSSALVPRRLQRQFHYLKERLAKFLWLLEDHP